MNSASNLFKWKHFNAEIILLTVRWYHQYRLSYRDLVEMMSERGIFDFSFNDHEMGTSICP
jgi:transposase-like protein